jgi:hypothetical protein
MEKGGLRAALRKANENLVLGGDDVHELAHASAIAELNRSRHSRKQRIVFTQTHILTGLCSACRAAVR